MFITVYNNDLFSGYLLSYYRETSLYITNYTLNKSLLSLVHYTGSSL